MPLSIMGTPSVADAVERVVGCAMDLLPRLDDPRTSADIVAMAVAARCRRDREFAITLACDPPTRARCVIVRRTLEPRSFFTQLTRNRMAAASLSRHDNRPGVQPCRSTPSY